MPLRGLWIDDNIRRGSAFTAGRWRILYMADYVLVHGGKMSADTWNKLAGREDYPPGALLGSRCWDGTVAALAALGHRVFAPALRDERSSSLTEHIDQIRTLILENNLNDIILVGHSYGGMVITGVAAKMAARVRRLVYLDAALPEPGQSLFDLIKLSLSAASESEPFLPEPVPPYVEKLQFDAAEIRPLPKTFILCTRSEFIGATRLTREKIAADKQGWSYIELSSSHVPMADTPDEFYKLLIDAADW